MARKVNIVTRVSVSLSFSFFDPRALDHQILLFRRSRANDSEPKTATRYIIHPPSVRWPSHKDDNWYFGRKLLEWMVRSRSSKWTRPHISHCQKTLERERKYDVSHDIFHFATLVYCRLEVLRKKNIKNQKFWRTPRPFLSPSGFLPLLAIPLVWDWSQEQINKDGSSLPLLIISRCLWHTKKPKESPHDLQITLPNNSLGPPIPN